MRKNCIIKSKVKQRVIGLFLRSYRLIKYKIYEYGYVRSKTVTHRKCVRVLTSVFTIAQSVTRNIEHLISWLKKISSEQLLFEFPVKLAAARMCEKCSLYLIYNIVSFSSMVKKKGTIFMKDKLNMDL